MLEMAKREKGWTKEVKKRERRYLMARGVKKKVNLDFERERERVAIILTEKVN